MAIGQVYTNEIVGVVDGQIFIQTLYGLAFLIHPALGHQKTSTVHNEVETWKVIFILVPGKRIAPVCEAVSISSIKDTDARVEFRCVVYLSCNVPASIPICSSQ